MLPILAIRPKSHTSASDLSSMLWDHSGATVDLLTCEATNANRWPPNIQREARGRLGAMVSTSAASGMRSGVLCLQISMRTLPLPRSSAFVNFWTGMVTGLGPVLETDVNCRVGM